ncbi:hypothetical protein [Pseudonocardia sp. WMMC193]|jgi:hypothetical protein|uniref:hypothetical protein n=1 Tax=Pseudonocardia sp. WMMC193 TaxID=2911965 RepID=UPI001F164994|nr:hypothetical protein [Pseudonocardia sp. WMMC193]MCF7550145.1 hypothetical protein [Pseudonocardia sp. WMMC193]
MSRTLRTPAGIPLPQLELLLGAAGWVAGTLGLGSGGGTLLMAAGLLFSGWWFTVIRRRHGRGARLPRELRTRALRVVAAVAVVLVALSIVLPMIGNGWGELTVPLGAVAIGVGLIALASVLVERSWTAVGGALVVLGAVGALLALNTAGTAVPYGVVGLGGAAVLWAAAARRTGAVTDVRERIGR